MEARLLGKGRLVLVVLVLGVGLVLALAGCGGAGEKTTATSKTAAETTSASAKALFVQKCGACHTLAAAGTTGRIGPALKGRNLSVAKVRDVIAMPKGSMPANLLAGEDAMAVSKFVSEQSK